MTAEISGFGFPFRIGPDGGIARASGDEKLRENLIHLLMTDIGERVMRRTFGGGLRQLLHDPNDSALLALAQHQIGRAVSAHEPRIRLQGVRARAEGSVLSVEVRYIRRRTGAAEQLVVPLDFGLL